MFFFFFFFFVFVFVHYNALSPYANRECFKKKHIDVPRAIYTILWEASRCKISVKISENFICSSTL